METHELDILLRRAKVKAKVYRAIARRIAGLTVACDDPAYAERLVAEIQAELCNEQIYTTHNRRCFREGEPWTNKHLLRN